jgi:hypothetical protein
MNWQDRVDSIPFSIETGDGKIFFPLYKGGETEKEFNTSSFEFISVTGTLVDRKKPKSRKLPLVFYFQGADNITQADEFEISCDDPRPWKVTHPFYGVINGQPMSIKRDDSSLNITEVTVPFWESIEADYPLTNFTIKDNTREKQSLVYAAALNSAITNVDFAAEDTSKMNQSILDMSGEMKKIQDDNTFSKFQNALNSGIKAIDKLLDEPLEAVSKIQDFLNLPATYERAIEGRVGNFENIYWRLKSSVKTLADKKYFESMGASTLASMSLTLVLPQPNDYVLVTDVENYVNRLSTIYNDYLETLDNLQTSIYNVNNSYSPDASVQLELNSLINFTVANLYFLSFETKRERIIVTNKQTNPILLVHRYLGMDDDDANLETFIKTNNLKLNDLFVIQKGTEIKFAK